MSGPYAFSLYIVPMLASVLLTGALGVYGLRHRSVPGAFAFAVVMLSMAAWGIGAILEVAAVDPDTKIGWAKFQAMWQFPAASSEFWFVLEYSHLTRLLNRRTAALMVGTSLLVFLLAITNDAHHLLWLGFTLDRGAHPLRGVANWLVATFGYLLALANLVVYAWLLLRSPRHRLPVAIILSGLLTTRVAFALDALNMNPVGPMDPTVVFYIFAATLYGLALFRFRFFDLIPIAYVTVITQMREGMLVIDRQRSIVDLNPAAAEVLAIPKARTRDRSIRDLPASAEWLRLLDDSDHPRAEIVLGEASTARYLDVQVSPMQDERRSLLGHVVMFHDITETKRAQAQLLEQQRTAAALQERDRIARDLHDSLGQVLGYVKMQGQAARNALAQNHPNEADGYLAGLVRVAQDAHADVREFILGASTSPITFQQFLPLLRQSLVRFEESYGIAVELTTAPDLSDHALAPTVWVQLSRIVQEALTNVRKHARATHIRVDLRTCGDHVQVVVHDNGSGFDPSHQPGGDGGFGLHIMQDRAKEVQGSVQIQSEPGKGTKVTILVPRREDHASTTR